MSNEFKSMLVDTHGQMKMKIQEANDMWNNNNTGQASDQFRNYAPGKS